MWLYTICIGCVGVHGIGAVWALVCVGLFTKNDPLNATLGYRTETAGLFYVRKHIHLSNR